MEDRSRGPGEQNEHSGNDASRTEREERTRRLLGSLGRERLNHDDEDDEEESAADSSHDRRHSEERQEASEIPEHESETAADSHEGNSIGLMIRNLLERRNGDDTPTERQFDEEADSVAEDIPGDELPEVLYDYGSQEDQPEQEHFDEVEEENTEESAGSTSTRGSHRQTGSPSGRGVSASTVMSAGGRTTGTGQQTTGGAGGAPPVGGRGRARAHGHGGGGGAAIPPVIAGGGGGNVVPNNPNIQQPIGANQLHNQNTNNRDPRLNRAVAGLLLVDAVDYLTTKKREKKIKKEIKSVEKKAAAGLKKVEQEHERVTAEHSKQLKEIIENRKRIEEKQLSKKILEKSIIRDAEPGGSTTIDVRNKNEIRTNIVENTTNNNTVEIGDIDLSREDVRLEKIKQLDSLQRPSAVLEAVKKAAEKDAAIEMLYERRHEARGNEDIAQRLHGAASSRRSPADIGQIAAWSSQQLPDDVTIPQIKGAKSRKNVTEQVARSVSTFVIILLLVFLVALIVTR